METINLAADEGLPPVEWATVEEQIATGVAPAVEYDPHDRRTTWLVTINADGSPHVTPVGAIWLDGSFWFQTGTTRKGRNVARDPRCSLTASVRDFDIVIEGEAVHVTDRPSLEKSAAAWASQGWPAEVDESGSGITAPFNAPTQGPAPWNVYRIAARSAIVCANVEPGGLSRFVF